MCDLTAHCQTPFKPERGKQEKERERLSGRGEGRGEGVGIGGVNSGTRLARDLSAQVILRRRNHART